MCLIIEVIDICYVFYYLMADANAADPLICVISGFGFLKEVAKECGSVVNVADCTGL